MERKLHTHTHVQIWGDGMVMVMDNTMLFLDLRSTPFQFAMPGQDLSHLHMMETIDTDMGMGMGIMH